MITNDAELAIVQEQRTLAEGALASLRREVLPRSKRNYEIFAEGYIEQIERLRNEIDGYLGTLRTSEPVPTRLTISFGGPEMQVQTVSPLAVTHLIERISACAHREGAIVKIEARVGDARYIGQMVDNTPDDRASGISSVVSGSELGTMKG